MSSPPQGFLKFLKIIQEILDEGIVLPFRDKINFTGAGVTATDNPGMDRTDVTIPGAVGGVFILGFHDDGGLGGGIEFAGWFSDDPTSSELDAQGFLAFAYTIVRGTAHVGTNSSGGATTLRVRKNGVDIAATTVTIPASTTGSFDTGAISEAVAAADLTNLEMDRTGGATFADYNYYVEAVK